MRADECLTIFSSVYVYIWQPSVSYDNGSAPVSCQGSGQGYIEDW